MLKIVCDLCGKEVPREEGYHLEIYDNKKLGNKSIGNIILDDEPDDACETYDVCEDCRQALADYFSKSRG